MANGCITEKVHGFLKLLLSKFKITVGFPFRLHFIFMNVSVFLQCASRGGCKGDILPSKESLVGICTSCVDDVTVKTVT